MKMIKRIIAGLIMISMLLTIMPITSVALTATEEARVTLEATMEEAAQYLYKDHTEQTAKYLYDRYLRAEATMYNAFASETEIFAAASELRNAISKVADMKGSERKNLISFDGISAEDLAGMKESVGILSLDKENKPENAQQSIAVTGKDGEAVYSNGDGAGGIVGNSPFGVDMQYTDGIRIWINVDKAARVSVVIGRRSAEKSYYFVVDEIPVSGAGYITLPYYYFENDTEAEMELTGVMNYISVSATGAENLAIADLHAYTEVVDEAYISNYKEEKLTTRAEIEDNAFYKLVTTASYESGTHKVVSQKTEHGTLSSVLMNSEQGNRAQLWQLSPDPSDNGTYRIINKSSGMVMQVSESGQLSFAQVDYNNIGQEFNFTATRGEFTIQVRNRGKLTTAGDSVKTTTSNTVKKFILLKVTEDLYTESWSDEFDAEKLDRDNWNVDHAYFFGGGNGCLYIDSEEQTYLENGELIMKTSMKDYNGYQASGSQLKSNGKFAMSFGKIEIRTKFTSGIGMWPSLWMMPVDSMNMARSEIDILELPVRSPEYAQHGEKLFAEQYGTLHWASDDGKFYEAKAVHFFNEDMVPFGNEYHTWGVEIDKDQIRMFLDGMLYSTLNFSGDGMLYAFADIPRYLILSPGGMQGDGICVADPNLDYQDITMQVDYVRTWIPKTEGTDATPDFTTEESSSEPSSVQYLAKNYNDYMSSMPMAISPDGTQAALADQAGFIAIFEPDTNKLIDSVSTGAYNGFLSVAYSADGSKLAAGTMQGSVVIYDTSDYSKPPVTIHNGATIHYDVLFANDDKYLITGGFNGGAQALENPINSSISEPKYFRVFDVETGALVKEVYLGSDPLSFDLSPDGNLLAVTTTSKGIFIFNTSDWSEYVNFTTDHSYTISHCEFTVDGKKLGTSDVYGNVNVWNVEEKCLEISLDTVNESSVREFAFSPDGKHIVTTTNDTAARLYEVATGRCISILGGFDGAVYRVGYSPDGKYIVAASFDHTMKLFAADGTYLETLVQSDELVSEGHIVSNLIFSNDSKYVFCVDASKSDAINRWELPESVDKTTLVDAINTYTGVTEALDIAKKIKTLKYATAKMVYDATFSLTGGTVANSFADVKVSGDNVSYANSTTAMKNAWVYFKPEIFTSVSSVNMVITNTTDSKIDIIPVTKEYKLGERESAEGYTEWIIRTYFENAGNYSVKFVDAITGEESNTISVEVSDVYTTRDFGYTINDDGTVTINSVIVSTADIYIPDYIDGYPVTEIASYTFSAYGKTLPNMTLRLPTTLKKISSYAFYECTSLKRLVLPEGLETIERYAFGRCLALEAIDIPDSVTTIEADAFNYTRGTNYIKVGTGMPNLAYGIFNRTFGNRTYIFEEGITSIPYGLNYQAPLIERIYLPKSVTSFSTAAFGNLRNVITIYGYPGSYAETFANANSSRYTFVPIAAPIISGIEDGKTYDLYTEAAPSLTWDHGHIAYLNGERYVAGKPITTPGEYTLTVVNGYDEYSTTVKFTVVDTTPPPYTLGDMDNDGEITVADALAILRIVAKLAVPEGEQNPIADINKDGVIAVDDALAVLRYVAKLANEL